MRVAWTLAFAACVLLSIGHRAHCTNQKHSTHRTNHEHRGHRTNHEHRGHRTNHTHRTNHMHRAQRKNFTKQPHRTTAPAPVPESLRVFNGVDAPAGQYPYVVALLSANKHRKCTGSLLTSTWVLTAAHCVESVHHAQYGDTTVPRAKITSVRILKWITHPGYKLENVIRTMTKGHNDIGLLLVQAVPVTVFGRLSAQDYRTMYGYKVEYAGFGLTGKTDFEKKKPLQLGEGIITSCISYAGAYLYPIMCVARKCGRRQNTMPGDSGGPLFHDGKIVAVVLGGRRFSRVKVFTAVSPFITWINQEMVSTNVTNAGGGVS